MPASSLETESSTWFQDTGSTQSAANIPATEVVEISEGDTGFEQMREAFPGITELRSSKAPVLIHWNGKNYLIQ